MGKVNWPKYGVQPQKGSRNWGLRPKATAAKYFRLLRDPVEEDREWVDYLDRGLDALEKPTKRD